MGPPPMEVYNMSPVVLPSYQIPTSKLNFQLSTFNFQLPTLCMLPPSNLVIL